MKIFLSCCNNSDNIFNFADKLLRNYIQIMNYIKTEIDGVFIIEPKVFNDSRGYFLRLLNILTLKST